MLLTWLRHWVNRESQTSRRPPRKVVLPRRTYRRLRLEALEDRTLLSGIPLVTTVSANPPAVEGGPAFTLTVNGNLFDSSSVVQFDHGNLPTTFVNSTKLTAKAPAFTDEGGHTVDVVNNELGGGTSPTVQFLVADAALFDVGPAITVNVALNNSIGSQPAARFEDFNPLALSTDFGSPTIDWGDSTTSPGTVQLLKRTSSAAFFGIVGSHTYTTVGTFQPVVQVNDVGGSTQHLADVFFNVAIRNDNALFASGLFHDLLNRPPSAADAAGLQAPLDTARFPLLRPEAAYVVFVQEYEAALISTWFQTYLSRPATTADQNYYIQSFFQKGATSEQVQSTILSTPEYYNNAPSFVGGGPATNTTYVKALIQQLYGRPATPGEISALTGMIPDSTQGERQNTALFVLTRSEYQIRLLSGYYQTFLGRPASTAEQQSFPAFYQGGGTDQQAVINIVSSAEYFQDNFNNTTAWVTSLFNQILLRAPQTSELQFNVLQITDGYTRAGAVNPVVTSQERQTVLINGWFNTYLLRAPDPVLEIPPLLQDFKNGMTDEQVQAIILGTQEYFNKAPLIFGQPSGTAPSNGNFVQALYKQLLNRTASQTELNSGIAALTSETRQAFAFSFLQSQEYRTLLIGATPTTGFGGFPNGGFFQEFLGRAPVASETSFFVGLLQNGQTDEQVVAYLLSSTEYFLRPHTFP